MSEQHAGEAMSCNGHSYHVFTLGADCCSLCGYRRYAPAKLPSPQPQHAGEHSPEPWTVNTPNLIDLVDAEVASARTPGHKDFADACHAELTALIARAPALQAENAKLREALRLVHDWRGLCDDGPVETFDRIARDFNRDTGFLRPGKDTPASMGYFDETKRRASWDEWTKRKNDEVDEAIRSALREGGAT